MKKINQSVRQNFDCYEICTVGQLERKLTAGRHYANMTLFTAFTIILIALIKTLTAVIVAIFFP